MKRLIGLLLTAAALLALALPGAAQETEAVPIYTLEDLLAMEQNPQGSYILMTDLDLSGVEWKAMDFSGSFDGNGHTILNLTIIHPTQTICQSCDGNRKLYDTTYFGFFGILRDARIMNLNLVNVRSTVEWDSPVFLGGLAGYAENCTITNCTLSGTLELRAHDRMFGVGGLVGYGGGLVEDCKVDVTLVNTDTDAETKDEQFLGGIYATGFMDVYSCEVKLDGYVSDHGYVHSGGIVGMYMEYPLGVGQKGYIKSNHVSGKITFFEDNNNRRAYCGPFVGEALVARWYLDYNTEEFTRDERFEYDRELRPEMCQEPVYTQEITEAGCENFGFTRFTCQSCGWSYTDLYTLPVHRVDSWTLIKAPTQEEEGLSTGVCGCGMEHERAEPKLEVVETTAPPQASTEPTETTAAPGEVSEAGGQGEQDLLLPLLLALDGVLAVLAVVLIFKLRKRR